MFITEKHISRRTVLRGMGVTMALPLLDAMIPARTAFAKTAAGKVRLSCIEMVHGSAGATKIGLEKNMWSPAAVGRQFDLSPSSLKPLEPFRDHVTIISNTDVKNAEAFELPEIGADHFRSSAVFLTQCHPRQTQSSNVRAGTSLDQFYAQRYGQDTPIPSMQLCIENVDQAGGCAYGYSCVYTDTISWASPTEPLPMIRDPRAAFDQLFGVGATAGERAANRRADRSILDWIGSEVSRLRKELGAADRARLADYLDDVREIERRIQRIEAYNTSGEQRAVPEAPMGVPDSFSEHVKLMFDLQVLAMQADITRVITFQMAREVSTRTYPQIGVPEAHHPTSHHAGDPEKLEKLAKINGYHVSLFAYYLEKLKSTADGDGSLLDHSVVMLGSGLGNPDVHDHLNLPIVVAGGAGRLKGGRHIKYEQPTALGNVHLTMLNLVGVDLDKFGDSDGTVAELLEPASL
jgi:Protein of unknown function (DUF1552)